MLLAAIPDWELSSFPDLCQGEAARQRPGGPPSCSWPGSPWSRRRAVSIFTPVGLCHTVTAWPHTHTQPSAALQSHSWKKWQKPLNNHQYIYKQTLYFYEGTEGKWRFSLSKNPFDFLIAFSFTRVICQHIRSQIFPLQERTGGSNMVIMTTFFAHDTQTSLPVNAWQDKPTSSKPLCLTASPSIPSAVPKDFIFHFLSKPTHLGTLFGHLPPEQD